MESLVLKIAAVGVAGIGAQWLAWRFRLPAIVLLLVAGLLIGPVTGFVVPSRDFEEYWRPFVAIAVAIILFEGGLTLNVREIRQTSTAVRRLVIIGAPLAWLLGATAAYYIAGLSWQASIIVGGILVVTGPTVIMPLLRQAKLGHRPASLLRWEAIINDPVGALFAVLAFEIILLIQLNHSPEALALRIGVGIIASIVGGYLLGKLIVSIFYRGLAPEYLKAPILFVAVLGAYAGFQMVLEESGLLTVTVMGITIANSKMTSLTEIKRFKEIITVLLVSGVFVLLTATVNEETISLLDWRAVAFVAAMLFVVRPIVTWTATIGSGLTWQERALIGWIAPRGVVAVAVASFFSAAMVANDIPDGPKMTAITFALVLTTVVLHGFSIGPMARALSLASTEKPGVLIVGGSAWSTALAKKLQEQKIPVMIADGNWAHLRGARAANIKTFYGEILSEAAEHSVDINAYDYLIAATDNDAYNTLVCTTFGYEFGRRNTFQLHPPERPQGDSQAVAFTLGGRPLLTSEHNYLKLERSIENDTKFTASKLSEKYSFEEFIAAADTPRTPVLIVRPDGELSFSSSDDKLEAGPEDVVISFGREAAPIATPA